LQKNQINIKEFIDKSIGEWKSLRSTHTIAFQEFENTTSNIFISYLSLDSSEVRNLLKKFSFSLNPKFAIQIIWEAKSDWVLEDKSEPNETTFIFSQKDMNSGTILRNKGYAEMIHTHSNYFIDQQKNLNIITEYSSIISEEKIWYISDHLRARYSLIKNKEFGSLIQTSHSTEIRKIKS
tara:strand:+ start:122 stop:661 length:540 start_codon:yes stop_codon:yes gene_type:complete